MSLIYEQMQSRGGNRWDHRPRLGGGVRSRHLGRQATRYRISGLATIADLPELTALKSRSEAWPFTQPSGGQQNAQPLTYQLYVDDVTWDYVPGSGFFLRFSIDATEVE